MVNNQQVKRMMSDSYGTYYGEGVTSTQIDRLTSVHAKGEEPREGSPRWVFTTHWLPETISYMYDGFVYVTWKKAY